MALWHVRFVLCLLCLLLNVNCYKWEANKNNFVALLIIRESFSGSEVKQWLLKATNFEQISHHQQTHQLNTDTRTHAHTYIFTHTGVIDFSVSFIYLRVCRSPMPKKEELSVSAKRNHFWCYGCLLAFDSHLHFMCLLSWDSNEVADSNVMNFSRCQPNKEVAK